jgi:hypothetical protein
MGTAIVVPIGPEGEAGQFPGANEIVGRKVVAEVKGRDMMVDRFAELWAGRRRGGTIVWASARKRGKTALRRWQSDLWQRYSGQKEGVSE